MGGTLSVTAHPRGDWVVTVGNRRLAVPPSLGRSLLPLHGCRPDEGTVQACLSGDDDAVSPDQAAAVASLLCGAATETAGRRRGALWLRIPLIPGRLVAPIAFGLGGLTSWPALAAIASFNRHKAITFERYQKY